MRRGTTPTITFEIPYAVSEVDKARITFTQGGKVLEKKLDDPGVSFSDYLIELTLTQEESLRFNAGPAGQAYAQVQIKLKLADGRVVDSNKGLIAVKETSSDEVI